MRGVALHNQVGIRDRLTMMYCPERKYEVIELVGWMSKELRIYV